MPDGILSIGAKFDKASLEGDFASASEMLRNATEGWSMAFESSDKKTRKAAEAMEQSVRNFAQNASANIKAVAVEAAEGFGKIALAQDHIRKSTVLMKDSTVDASFAISSMAASQQELAAAMAGQPERMATLAAATAATAKEMAYSSNMIVAGFQRAGIEVRESLTSMQEKLIETAETGKLSAEGITAGFAGISKLLGAGIAVGFAAHFLDETAKFEIELDHLSAKTGITIQYLAGLQQIVKQTGGDFEAISTGLVRMDKNLADSIAPSKQLTEALAGIGVKVEDLKGLKPEEKLEILAKALAATTNDGNRAAAAIAVFGKGGAALIPILREQGSALETNVISAAKLVNVTDESVRAAYAWQEATARLSAEFRSVMLPVIGTVEVAIARFASMLKYLDADIWAVIDVVGAAARSLGAFGKLVGDAMSMNYVAMVEDTRNLTKTLASIWNEYGNTVMTRYHEAAALGRWQVPTATSAPPPSDESEVDTSDKDKPGKKHKGVAASSAAFRQDEGELNALRLAHEVTLEEEIAFWQKRLEAVRKGSEEYRAIQAKLAPLMQREMKKPQDSGDLRSADLSEAMISQEALDKAVKANSDAVKETIAADREGAEEKMRIAAEDYRDVETSSAFEVQMGRMTAAERLQVLRQAAVQENQIRQEQSRFIQLLDMNNRQRYAQDLKQEEQATRQFTRIITQLNQQSALDFQKSWRQGLEKMTSEFNANVARWTIEGQGFEQSMAKAMAGVSQNFVQNVMKMMEQEVLAAVQHKSLMKTQILGDAKTAAADAFKWASGWGGPIAGAVAAAAAFAGVMAFDSFSAGGMVQGGGGMAVPILAHAGERVLSQSQTENFHKLVNNSSSSSSSSSTTHLHLQQNVSAYDRSGMRSTLKAHADDLLDIVQDGIKSGKLKYA